MSNITNTFNNIEKYTIDDLEKSNVLASYESVTGNFKIKNHCVIKKFFICLQQIKCLT